MSPVEWRNVMPDCLVTSVNIGFSTGGVSSAMLLPGLSRWGVRPRRDKMVPNTTKTAAAATAAPTQTRVLEVRGGLTLSAAGCLSFACASEGPGVSRRFFFREAFFPMMRPWQRLSIGEPVCQCYLFLMHAASPLPGWVRLKPGSDEIFHEHAVCEGQAHGPRVSGLQGKN